MAWFVGVDGGNTKTQALVCDERGEVRGEGAAGSSNWEGMGFPEAAAVLTGVISEALARAGGGRTEVGWMHFGLAGMDWPEDETRMEEALVAAGWPRRMSLENDAFSGIRATAPGGSGIGVTAGTSIASGVIRPDGGKYFYGAFTDLGGGWDIDVQVWQAVVRAEDGRGPATALTAALLAATGCATAVDFVHLMHREHERPSRADTRHALFGAAAQGDAVAVAILTRYAGELALCATNLLRRYQLEQEPVPVVAAGSLFQRTGPQFYALFREALARGAPNAQPILADHPPLMGAVRGAVRAGGVETPAVWERLCRSAVEGGWLRELGVEAKGDGNGET